MRRRRRKEAAGQNTRKNDFCWTFAIYASNSERECKSFISYIKTKLVRFLMLPSISSGSINNLEAWRFVPDPGKFDHIFADQELYQRYGLTPDEIAIIESVIKERKHLILFWHSHIELFQILKMGQLQKIHQQHTCLTMFL